MSNPRSRRKRKTKLSATAVSGASSTGGSTDSEAMLRDRLAGITVKMAERLFQLEKAMGRMEGAMRATDYKLLATQKLLASAGIEESDIAKKVEELQLDDFYEASARDDLAKGLTSADGESATVDGVVIVSIRYFKDGVEIPGSAILRSKINVSAADSISKDLKESILGKNVGDSIDIKVADGITGTVTIHNVLKAVDRRDEGES